MCLLLPQGSRGSCLSHTVGEGTDQECVSKRVSSFQSRSCLKKVKLSACG